MSIPRFTIAYWCVLLVAFMPYLCAILAKWGGAKQRGGRYDNAQPRQWLAQLIGWPMRANAAQTNCFEAMPFFFVAVLLAHQMRALQGTLDMLCVLFVVVRLLYVLMYLANMATLRSVVWFMAFALNLAIFFAGF
jgi:uncharacterized MAPEG superfamily protein